MTDYRLDLEEEDPSEEEERDEISETLTVTEAHDLEALDHAFDFTLEQYVIVAEWMRENVKPFNTEGWISDAIWCFDEYDFQHAKEQFFGQFDSDSEAGWEMIDSLYDVPNALRHYVDAEEFAEDHLLQGDNGYFFHDV